MDSEGNLDGDASDAEIYINGFYLRTSTLDKRPLAKVLFARGGKRVKVKGEGDNTEPFPLTLFPTNAQKSKVLTAAPVLRWQQSPSAGVNHILTPTFLQKDIILTNGTGVHAIPISEFVLAFMLYHAKNLRKLQTLQNEQTWVRGVFSKSWQTRLY